MKRIILIGMAICAVWGLKAQSAGSISGLDKAHFGKYWKVESESPDYEVSFSGDTCEILSPKGLTLWRKEKMCGNVVIEYDACVVDEGKPGDRLSDLNCFWMASDPQAKNIWQRMDWRKGEFLKCYSLQLYYLGYGGNYNSTTRFRRYDGNQAGVTDAAQRPGILKEYTDKEHLLVPNKWYHVKLVNKGDRVQYYIDGKRLVDYCDPNPLREGWFGFRTTLSRTRIANFRYICREDKDTACLHWVGEVPSQACGVSFGVPFRKGEVQPDMPLLLQDADGKVIASDSWTAAYWPDGSVKWAGMAAVVPGGTTSLQVVPKRKSPESPELSALTVEEIPSGWKVSTGVITAYVPRSGSCVIDSLLYGKTKVGGAADLIASVQDKPSGEGLSESHVTHFSSRLQRVSVERTGKVRATLKLEGVHQSAGREWLPFVLRLYFYAGSEQVRMVHSFVFDGEQDKDFIRSIGVRFRVPMREALYNRHVAFACAEGGVWSEPVQPLVGRRVLTLGDDKTLQQQQMEGKRIPAYEQFDEKNRDLLDHWAAWDNFRLSQLTDNAFSIRKRAEADRPWIGTFTGTRSDGFVFAGDVSGGIGVGLQDFWQAYPASLEVRQARSDEASLIVWLWSPEAEAMDLRHYDSVAHDLNASYEDVQEGMSTPYGIARTHTLTLVPKAAYPGKKGIADIACLLAKASPLLCTPEYLHACRAFGIWSLPDRSNPARSRVEDRLEAYISFYQKAIEQHKWYGFWNYGDFMHAYDPVRHEWRYDVGGFAWDNTELASNMWLWYNFLRTGRYDIWKMAEAMTRHTAEVDVYHIGPNAGLGSRHNVSHWGCGAKEARISQAAWNRFYYYLTTDERSGDLMTEVKDADQKLYTLDPMRLAEPRSKFPSSAPARLRIGPDWLAYAGNWMTEWERTRDRKYLDKIVTGMNSIASLPNGLFTGNKALGFYPDTGVITYEGDPTLKNTNHLMTIMGGFELMNEMQDMIDVPAFNQAWLEHARDFKLYNHFRVSRLQAYAAWHLYDPKRAAEAWTDLWGRLEHTPAPPMTVRKIFPPEVPAPLDECMPISTNDAALWSLDAIYMQEVIPQ